MNLTLNQIAKRIETISLSHQQVRRFYFGKTPDFLVGKVDEYAVVSAFQTGGFISISSKEIQWNIKMGFFNLVNVAADTDENELDVISDTLSIAAGIIAKMNSSEYYDWAVVTTSSFNVIVQHEGDMIAGVEVDVSVRIPWDKNYCEEPFS